MKKFLFVLVAVFSLSFISCFSNKDKLQESEQTPVKTQEIKSGVVHRIFQGWTVFSVRLRDGKILVGFCSNLYDCKGKKQIKDFFFAQPGDTIVYSGEKVLEVRFND